MRFAVLVAAFTFSLAAHAQWQMLDSRTTADLRGIDNVGKGIVWASGTNGTILRSEDAGYMWQVCAKPPGGEKLDFRGIQGFDANTAIAMSSGPGDQSRLYKTTDGCQTWKLVFTNPDKQGFWDSFRINRESPSIPSRDWQEQSYGVLVGDPIGAFFDIWETHDSGSTWRKFNVNDRKHEPEAERDEALFAASNQALVVPGNNNLFSFVTGGSHSRICTAAAHSPFDAAFWVSVGCHDVPLPTGKSAGAFAIGARTLRDTYRDLMIVGGDYAYPDKPSPTFLLPAIPRMILGYKSGRRSLIEPHGYRSAVAYDAKAQAWITVGPNGTDVSFDDGRNWHPLTPGPQDPPDADKNWNALSLPFVVGPHGRIGMLRENELAAAAKRWHAKTSH